MCELTANRNEPATVSCGRKDSDNRNFDLFIVGGGINGCGIARDAAGRGLRVALAEMNDLGSATSSASTKLFHGGLRYLEYLEFRLVRESLRERETLLGIMPHISWPMRFVLPYRGDMRFAADTPVSRLISTMAPWMKGRRPAWLIRLGLLLYDTLGSRNILPGTTLLDLTNCPEGQPLHTSFRQAFEYSDCWVEDSRLVVLNARDAHAHGARIMPHTKVTAAKRDVSVWTVTCECEDGTTRDYTARALVNAAGPWVGDVLDQIQEIRTARKIRLVRGSHIVTRRLYSHNKCYFFQGTDGRIMFAIPYERDFTLIGTTDQDHTSAADKPECSDAEMDYLLEFANAYFSRPLSRKDVIWSYSGLRPLVDDGTRSAASASRDYVLELDFAGPPLLNIFGGKITTYRRLAENAIERLADHLSHHGLPSWTGTMPLPGGDFPVGGVEELATSLQKSYPFLSAEWAMRLIRAYGTDARRILGNARAVEDLGEQFPATITARELEWSIANEWTSSGEDFLWRRTKLGLRLNPEEVRRIDLAISEIREELKADKVEF
ncbi:MAG: glycerol-3-phosphate dehydrogenase [Rhodobacteraceae bacterium]|nr:glycerol-3-phosphate dehydrogenase [Paracoccaceae bacterium]